jgi:hypothetical protein
MRPHGLFRHDHTATPLLAAEPPAQCQRISRSRAVRRGEKVASLDPRTLLQEQAFEHGGRGDGGPLRILHAGPADGPSVRTRFRFFLRRVKTRHIILLAAEALIVPVTGLAALLPGPNIIFYVLAIFDHPVAGPAGVVGSRREYS